MSRRVRMQLGAERGQGTLGTFAGVFTPSVLTILGIILFLRLGFVVGNAGLGGALAIIALATAISVLTSLSLAAVATNIQVKGGGDYYLISRTLGVEFGGAIGVVLFLAQAVSIAFYCIGFGEAVALVVPAAGPAAARQVALGAVLVLGLLAWLGSDWATRFQYVVMAILVAALASVVLGGLDRWSPELLRSGWTAPGTGLPFWTIFAIFFPAVTGFTQGVSMSGDLADPGRSIPRGTFTAVGLSTLVYLGVAVLLAAALPITDLASDYGAMRRIADHPWLIDAGVMAATLSSGLASFLGAPRILQSMARDRIFPPLVPFAAGVGPTDNPRRAVLVAATIATATVGLGKLNLIAPIVSMFFLMSYGLLNYATYYEARAASPSFRPRFRWFDARASLVGSLGCLGAMLAIHPTAAIVAGSLLLAIHQYLRRTAGPARWADGSRSYNFQRVREHLYAMADHREHPRDWRPKILAFSNDAPRRRQLLRFASLIEGGSGLTTVVRIVGEGRPDAEAELAHDIAAAEVQAFPLVVQGRDLQQTARILVQSFGLGPIRANIILLNWREPSADSEAGDHRFGRYLRLAVQYGCNVVVLAADEDAWARLEAQPSDRRRIDVVWRNDATGELMLLLAHLMTRAEPATVRVLAGARSERTAEQAQDRLEKRLADVRIDAEVEVVPDLDGARLAELSADAALVLLPIRLSGDALHGPFGTLEQTLEGLPVVALVVAAEDITLDAGPDEGHAAEVAAAVDAAADATKEAERAEREAGAREKDVARAAEALEQLADDAPEEKRKTAEQSAAAARAAASTARQQAASARARADEAGRRAEALGAPAKSADDDAPP